MSRILIVTAALFSILLICVPLAHAEKTTDVQIKPWFQVFFDYSYNFSGYEKYDERFEQNDANKFDFSRTWIGLDANLTPDWFARVVLDTARQEKLVPKTATASTGKKDIINTPDINESEQEVVTGFDTQLGAYTPWLTYAFVRYQPFKYLNWDIGLVQNAWGAQLFKYWRHEYVMAPLVYANRLIRATYGDLGTAVGGEIPGGWGGYRVALLQGEGKRSPEANEGKAVEARAYVVPLALIKQLQGLQFMGFYRYDIIQPHAPRLIDTFYDVIGAFRYDVDDAMGFSVNGEYAAGVFDTNVKGIDPVNRAAWSAWADFWFATQYGVLGRYDFVDPDTKNDKKTAEGYRDEKSMLLAGVFYYPIKNVKLCASYRQLGYTAKIADDNQKQVDMPPDQYFYFSTEFNTF